LLCRYQWAKQSCDMTAVARFADRRWMYRLSYSKVAVLLVKHAYLRTTCMYKPLVMTLVVSLL